ncbi:spore germination protein [Desulfonispora thiosulfatigenes DSM 11270]|uniref:Spore germination protein n=1 Tax=Desulfonispora thiosulfatigenes DSM 11270 TaxID=656914 RepID=A0A1W1UZ85_DESTI|nr:germination protein YpeB [Desulfonispora thiosulfatigenes]SMB86379.1 spore germination protein [Desulfonispora thiosulfatigenes DSM 11270]
MRKTAISLLLLAFIAVGYYGYNQYQDKEQLVRRTEIQYQKNFHELVWGIDSINSQLAQTLVSSSPKQIMFSLTNLWRQSFSAQNNLSGIPVAMIELDRTDKVLSDIAEYSYYLLQKNNLEKQELTEKEWAKIQDLYKRSKIMGEELHEVEASVIDQNLSFVDLETEGIIKGKELTDNKIVDGLTKIENKVKAFPELEFDQGVQKIEPELKPIVGKRITKEKALEAATNFMNAYDGPVQKVEVAFENKGKIATFGIKAYKKGNKNPTYLEVSKNGGHVVQLYVDRPIKEVNINDDEALKKATEFLNKIGLKDITRVETDSDTNITVFTFVPNQGKTLLYTDMIKVQVALDNGQITSFDQSSYLAYHHQRDLPAPKKSPEEVTAGMNPNFKVNNIRLAVIPGEFEDKEILVYDVRGSIEEETFILFVNALTGEDERIVRLTKPEVFPVRVR